MALYYYKALSKTGAVVTGTFDASSEVGVRAELVSKGLYPVQITSQTQSAGGFSFFSLFLGNASTVKIIGQAPAFAIGCYYFPYRLRRALWT